METVELEVERRSVSGKGAARKLRAAGLVPAVIYGARRTTTSISVRMEQLDKRVTHLEGSHLIRLVDPPARDPELHEKMVLVRELQRHPVSGRVLHADFFEVDLTERLEVSVPLHFVGRAAGVVAGGILQPVMREIDVQCLPTEIPQFVEVDVSPLGIHDAFHVADLKLPERVSAVGDPTRTVVTVLPPSVETAPTAGAEAAAEGAPAGEAAAEGAGAKKAGGGEEKGG